MKNKLNKLLAILLCILMAVGSLAAVVEGELPQGQSPVTQESPVPEDGEQPACSCPDVEGVDKTAADYVHEKSCPLYEKLCSCEATDEEKAAEGFVHGEDCDFFVALANAWLELYEKLMATQTAEEFSALVLELSTEDEAAFVSAITDEQLEVLYAHIEGLAEPNAAARPQTVNFTAAGPLLPAVTVKAAGFRRSALKATAKTDVTPDNGLQLSKTAVANADGTYTITLESYTTGSVTTAAAPTDIVLVLDQSGSMAYDFSGESTSTNSARRQYAMKNAVNRFIEAVGDSYDASTADHRIAIVTFASSASTLRGWTSVNSTGEANLTSAINGLPASPSGATNVAAGMTQAQTLMGSGYNYNGANTTRQKVVIVFTDGVPTTGSSFNITVANSAINSAKSLKDSGVTIYSVGIFGGANPDQLHGEKADYGFYTDVPCTGDVGSVWGDNYFSQQEDDVIDRDIPAGNRFLNYLSSNFSGATGIGLEIGDYNPGGYWLGSITGYRITANAARTGTGYYLTANNSTALNEIFQQISQSITPDISLGSTAVIRDVVSPYFDLPENTSDIKVYTAAKTASGWADRVESTTITPTVSDNTVSVTGFDYNANVVTGDPKEDGTYGSKLILEFTVTVKEGFIGGNKVPTNLNSSAVFENAQSQTPIEAYPIPTVTVPISFDFNTSNQEIYLGQAAQLEALIDLTSSPDGVNNAFVEIKYEIIDSANNTLGTLTIPAGSGLSGGSWTWQDDSQPYLRQTSTYTVKCTVSPAVVEAGGVTAYQDSKNAVVTVNTCTLTITKTGAASQDVNQGFIFNVIGANLTNCDFADEINLDVSVNGNGSVTITGLPVGTYTVTEDGWSWRYTASAISPVVLDGNSPTATATVTNTRTNPYLLDGSAYAQNIGTASAVSN